MMKLFIGAASIAIVAAGGFAIGKPLYDSHRGNVQKADAMSALVDYAHGEDRVAMTCRLANKNPELFRGDDAVRVVNTCYAAGISTLY